MCVALPGLRSRRCRHKCCTLLPLLLPFMLSGQPPLNNYAQLTIKNYSSWYQKVYTLYIVLKIALVQLLKIEVNVEYLPYLWIIPGRGKLLSQSWHT